MSLATRCNSCETVFRVVQDQLKVSDGWVRCGRCDAVFNALESLFDLEREGPHVTPVPPAPASTPQPVAFEAEADADDIELTTDWTAPEPQMPVAHEPEPEPEPEPDPDPEPALSTADAASTASFLVDPRRSRWHTTPVRLALAAVSAALLAGIAGQALHHFRDQVAARWAQSLPLLTAWCKVSGCVVAPLRQIDDVAVESTALTRTTEADTFTLAVGLRNHGALRVALPSLDLTLTDADGQLVARRALAPLDFPSVAPTLAPGAEAMLNVTLATGSPRVRGYTVEVFYP